ncbi:hypothetical protein ACVDFE_37260 [Lentzea chajnantorensis]
MDLRAVRAVHGRCRGRPVIIFNNVTAIAAFVGLVLGNDAQFNGQKAERVFDTAGTQPGEMQLVFEPSFGSDKAAFVGQA